MKERHVEGRMCCCYVIYAETKSIKLKSRYFGEAGDRATWQLHKTIRSQRAAETILDESFTRWIERLLAELPPRSHKDLKKKYIFLHLSQLWSRQIYIIFTTKLKSTKIWPRHYRDINQCSYWPVGLLPVNQICEVRRLVMTFHLL